MTARLIRKSWWVDFRIDYIRYRIRSPENSQAGARAYEISLRQRLARGDNINRRAGLSERQTFAEFTEGWFRDYVQTNNKPSEQRTKKYVLSASLVPFFGRMVVSEIGVRDIERYKAALLRDGISRKTINNRLSILRKCLHTAYGWLAIKGMPPKIEWLKCPPPHTDYLTQHESALLVTHSNGVVGEMILAALRTGMRQGEIKGLQWSSIDWQNRILVVRHNYSDHTKSLGSPKGNRERHIPLDLDLEDALIARRQAEGFVFVDDAGRPFDHYRLGAALARVCERAGIRKIGWHALRHTFASHLAMNGTPLNLVQALLGHVSIEMTMRYAHVAPSALRTAIDLANPRTAATASVGQPAGNRWQERQLSLSGSASENPGKTSA